MKKALASIAVGLALVSTAFASAANTNFKVTTTPPTAVKKGQPAVAKVHIEGTNGFGVNVNYPMQLIIKPPAGVTVDKATQTKADTVVFKTTGADFNVTFTSADVGTKAFTGELKFGVATEKEANPVTTQVAFSVDVK